MVVTKKRKAVKALLCTYAEEREKLWELRSQTLSRKEIARQLGKDAEAIPAKIDRNDKTFTIISLSIVPLGRGVGTFVPQGTDSGFILQQRIRVQSPSIIMWWMQTHKSIVKDVLNR